MLAGHKKFGLHISDESSPEESSGCSDLDDDEDNKVPWQSNEHKNASLYRLIEIRKQFLVSKIRPFQDNVGAGNRSQVLQTYIDYESAELISRYLASKRPFSQSFDRYLRQVSMNWYFLRALKWNLSLVLLKTRGLW